MKQLFNGYTIILYKFLHAHALTFGLLHVFQIISILTTATVTTTRVTSKVAMILEIIFVLQLLHSWYCMMSLPDSDSEGRIGRAILLLSLFFPHLSTAIILALISFFIVNKIIDSFSLASIFIVRFPTISS